MGCMSYHRKKSNDDEAEELHWFAWVGCVFGFTLSWFVRINQLDCEHDEF